MACPPTARFTNRDPAPLVWNPDPAVVVELEASSSSAVIWPFSTFAWWTSVVASDCWVPWESVAFTAVLTTPVVTYGAWLTDATVLRACVGDEAGPQRPANVTSPLFCEFTLPLTAAYD